MKMNIKGLVFVGFAAAVFASAANAASDKIVTSKTYVDAKISDAATISNSSTTTAPNEKAVYDALGTKQNIHISDNDADHGKTLIVGDNGNITISSVSAVDDTNTTYTFASGDTPKAFQVTDSATGTPQTVAINGLGTASTADVSTNGVINDESGLVNGDQVYDFVTNQLASNQADWDETDPNDPSYINHKPGVFSTTAAGLAPQAASDATKVLNAGGTWSTNDTTTVATGDANGKIAVTHNGTTEQVSVYGLGNAAYQGFDDSNTGISSTSGDTAAPSSKAVYDFVTAQTGDVLPDNPTGENEACSTTNPCALVWDGNTTTGPEWKRIQQ